MDLQARLDKSRVTDTYSTKTRPEWQKTEAGEVVEQNGLPVLGQFPSFVSTSGKPVVIDRKIGGGSYGEVFNATDGGKRVTFKKIMQFERGDLLSFFNGKYLNPRVVPQDIKVVEEMESCNEEYEALHVNNVTVAFFSVKVTSTGWSNFHRLPRGAKGWMYTYDWPSNIEPGISTELALCFFQVMERCEADMGMNQYVTRYLTRPVSERVQHFKVIARTLVHIAKCSSMVLTDVKRENTLLRDINGELFPIIGDLGSFFSFNYQSAVSTFSVTPRPVNTRGQPVRGPFRVNEYAGRLGVLAAYTIFDTIVGRTPWGPRTQDDIHYFIIDQIAHSNPWATLYAMLMSQDEAARGNAMTTSAPQRYMAGLAGAVQVVDQLVANGTLR